MMLWPRGSSFEAHTAAPDPRKKKLGEKIKGKPTTPGETANDLRSSSKGHNTEAKMLNPSCLVCEDKQLELCG